MNGTKAWTKIGELLATGALAAMAGTGAGYVGGTHQATTKIAVQEARIQALEATQERHRNVAAHGTVEVRLGIHNARIEALERQMNRRTGRHPQE